MVYNAKITVKDIFFVVLKTKVSMSDKPIKLVEVNNTSLTKKIPK